ncbi:MAG: hypothetical protein AB1568_08560 [Thermodesulfobacteriota bacterium]
MTEQPQSSGVQQLIDRLRRDGIGKGREESERLVAEAHAAAKKILDEANGEAERLVAEATREAQRLHETAKEAVQLAARDMILDLKGGFSRQFSRRIAEMVGDAMSDPLFIQKVILQLAGRLRETVGEGEKVELILPDDVIGLDELRRHPEKLKEGPLGRFVLDASRELFSEGVTVVGGGAARSITVRLVDQSLDITMDEETISELLLDHLLPRFRALLEGAIR